MGIVLPIAQGGHEDQQRICSDMLGPVTGTWQKFNKALWGDG